MNNHKTSPKTDFTSPPGTTVFMDEAVVSTGPNYAVAGGTNNALTATITSVTSGTLITPIVGTSVILKTMYSLQKGANTFNLNGHGTNSIVSQHNVATNIETIIAAGAMLELIFDGTYWQAVGY